MNVGINDAAILANCIIRGLKTGNDIGSPQTLDEYETHAKLMNYSTSFGIEGIKKLYETNRFETFNLIRNMGASAI